MDNFTDENCDCPMECNSISYTFSIVSTPFDSWKMCPRKMGTKDLLMKEFYKRKFPPMFIRKLNQVENKNISIDDENICKKNIQYRAEIIFRIATNTLSVTVMSRRLSFFDQLSAFGRNINCHLNIT